MYSLIVASTLFIPAQAPKVPATLEAPLCASTVRIYNESNGGYGNGVVILRSLPNAYVLTSAHLLKGKNDRLNIEVFPPGGDPVRIKGVTVEKMSNKDEQDLALLKFNTDKDTVQNWVKIPSEKHLPGRKQFAAFSAASTQNVPSVARGETINDAVQLQKPNFKPAWFWKSKKHAEPGRSGSPLVDAEGRLIGICTGGDNQFTYYAHIQEIVAFLEQEFNVWTLIERD